MNALPPVTELNTHPASTGPRVTIMYEDRLTGLRAKHFSDMLVASLGGGVASPPACWRCELLELPEIAEEIARDAAASEFVILSLRGDTSLSAATKLWVESWLDGAVRGPISLVALFDPERSTGPQTEGVRCYLRHVTATAGVAFFAHCPIASSKGAATPSPEEGGPITMEEPPWRSGNVIASFFPAASAHEISRLDTVWEAACR